MPKSMSKEESAYEDGFIDALIEIDRAGHVTLYELLDHDAEAENWAEMLFEAQARIEAERQNQNWMST